MAILLIVIIIIIYHMTDHVTSKSQRAGSSPPPQPEGAYRVIAVAKTNVNAVMEEGSALAFKKGDNIVVQGR